MNTQDKLIRKLSKFLFETDFIGTCCVANNVFDEYDILASDILGNLYEQRNQDDSSPFELFRYVYDRSFYTGATKEYVETSERFNDFLKLLEELNQAVRDLK